MHHNEPIRFAALSATLLFAATLLCGCTWRLKDAPPAGIDYYSYLGSVQCTGGGKSVTELEQELIVAGITVYEIGCGTDGKLYTSVCGAPDGRIGIFNIDPAKAKSAAALGLAPLDSLPHAVKTPCDVR